MSVHNTGDSSRKPSGSSTHSGGGHSPPSPPNNSQSQRKSAAGTSGNMFGVSMGGTAGLKGLNSGWQVWGATPSSKRNASTSSITSDLSPPQGDPNYRGNLGEGWTTSRPTSGTWDDVNGSPKKKDYSQLDSHTLHHARQRQAAVAQTAGLSGARLDERSTGSKAGQFSPQRYDNSVVKDSNTSRYPSSVPSNSTGFSTGSYAGQQPSGLPASATGSGYDSASKIADNELVVALRGMAVEDDYTVGQHRQQMGQSQPSGHPVNPPIPQIRAPPVQQPRAPYNAYGQADYSAYYSNPPTREPYIDYQYGYDAYRGSTDLSVYSQANGMNGASASSVYSGTPQHPNAQQSGLFYDYNGGARPAGSQFYYPTHQAVLYPPSAHSPMLTNQLANPATLSDKKRELQYNIQQQITPQNLMYSQIRSSPSPHTQAYGAALDYSAQLPVMLPGGTMYGPGVNQQAMHLYQQGMRGGRIDNEPAATLRSQLLEDFRANKARKWELRDIFGSIVEFSGDQHGSRFIQQKLETATSEEKQIIFDEIVPDNALQLIQDVFGNYVIQKMFEHGTQVQKTVLANTMEGHVLPLSLQMYGCRVVQKAVEYILPDHQGTFVKELDAHVLRCVKDANGNHVIQKLVERVAPERLAFVHSFRGNVYDLSTHPYGCRVLQRCFEHLPEEQTRPLLDELHKYAVNLMQDQFGNYVVQFVLEHGQPQDKALVITKLRGQMLQMARHKFASNVCEKALVTADPESRRVLIDEIMTPKQDGVSPIVTMMKDQFANYVLQRALAVAEGLQKEELINKVRPQLASMRRYSSAYSKHLISIERLLEKCTTQDKVQDFKISPSTT